MVIAFDRELQVEVTKFTKLCKHKQEQLLASCAKEEKRIKDDFEEQMLEASRKHRRQQEQLRKKLEHRKKALHRKLEHEMRVELKLCRRYVGVRAKSTGRLNAGTTSGTESVDSLREQHPAESEVNQTHELPSTLPLNGVVEGEQHRRKWVNRGLRNKRNGDLSQNPELHSTLQRLEKEMDDRLRFADNEARMAVAQLEWEFMCERHDIKRGYMEAMADFKQRRLSSLGQIKVCQIKGYFDIHRKWLIDEQTRELSQRQRASQEALKRLALAQEIERQTACRLAKTTARGQKQVSQVMYTVKQKENKILERSAGGTGSKEVLSVPRPMSAETTLIDRLYPKPEEEHIRQENSSHSGAHIYRPLSLFSSTGIGFAGTDERVSSAHTTPTQGERESSQVNGSTSSSRRLIPKSSNGRIHSRIHLRHSKSVQSIHSALDTCEHMQRAVITSLSQQQVEQWTQVLNQERGITDALMQAHAEQKKLLIEEETAALKRAQTEQENRSSHLAVVLEATEKFAEKEFATEQNRLTAYYYGNSTDQSGILQAEPVELMISDFGSMHTGETLPQASPSLESALDYYPINQRVDKSITVNDDRSLRSTGNQSSRSHVIICREEMAH